MVGANVFIHRGTQYRRSLAALKAVGLDAAIVERRIQDPGGAVRWAALLFVDAVGVKGDERVFKVVFLHHRNNVYLLDVRAGDYFPEEIDRFKTLAASRSGR